VTPATNMATALMKLLLHERNIKGPMAGTSDRRNKSPGSIKTRKFLAETGDCQLLRTAAAVSATTVAAL
jgi:hypothetical protein